MSVAQLAAAIQKLSTEKDQGMIGQHLRDIVAGVQQIGRRLADLENRVKALEGQRTSERG
jgi:septal ring factor EnvC (AmiA/AmiB activator)